MRNFIKNLTSVIFVAAVLFLIGGIVFLWKS